MRQTNKQLAKILVDEIESGAKPLIATDEIVRFLAKTGETHRLYAIIQAIETIWREKYGAATITVETVHPISPAIRKKLEEIAPGAEIREIVNESIIGGAKIRIDDRVVDSSLSGCLERLRLYLMNA